MNSLLWFNPSDTQDDPLREFDIDNNDRVAVELFKDLTSLVRLVTVRDLKKALFDQADRPLDITTTNVFVYDSQTMKVVESEIEKYIRRVLLPTNEGFKFPSARPNLALKHGEELLLVHDFIVLPHLYFLRKECLAQHTASRLKIIDVRDYDFASLRLVANWCYTGRLLCPVSSFDQLKRLVRLAKSTELSRGAKALTLGPRRQVVEHSEDSSESSEESESEQVQVTGDPGPQSPTETYPDSQVMQETPLPDNSSQDSDQETTKTIQKQQNRTETVDETQLEDISNSVDELKVRSQANSQSPPPKKMKTCEDPRLKKPENLESGNLSDDSDMESSDGGEGDTPTKISGNQMPDDF